MTQPTDVQDPFRRLFEEVRDYAIFVLDREGRVRSWNAGARAMNGYAASEIIGEGFPVFYPDDERGLGVPERALEVAASEGRLEQEGWRIRKDGSRFWANVVITALHDDAGALRGFATITRDFTERRRTEETLRQSEERFRLVVDGVREYAIFMLDPDGRVASWNRGARRIKGYGAEEVLGRHFSLFFSASDAAGGKPGRLLERALRDGTARDEGWRVRKDGTTFWADVTITALHDAEGRHRGFAKVTRDSTERRRADEAVRQMNVDLEQRVEERTAELERAVRARDDFFSVASHELKTPLTALLLQIRTIQQVLEADAPEALRRTLDPKLVVLARQADRLTTLSDLLLDVTRISSGRLVLEREAVDAAEIVHDVVQRMRDVVERTGSTLEIRTNGPVPGWWDRTRLETVVANLLSNAAKYGAGNPIEVEVEVDGRGPMALIRVSDRGIGIPPDRLPAIFERFERAVSDDHYGGFGIGLWVVRQTVAAHGGTVHAASRAGGGTIFTVELPLDAPAERQAAS